MGVDFSLTREQEEIRDLAHEFAEKEMRPVAERYDEAEETPWDVMRKAHALGLDATASFPEQYGGGGIDLITNIRKGSTIPAIALTGFGMEEDVAKCLDAGFNDHLTKPVNLQKLEMTIRQLGSRKSV